MELTITLNEPEKRMALFGAGDRNLRRIAESLRVRINARNTSVRVLGEPADVAKAAAVVERLQNLLRDRAELPERAVEEALGELRAEESDKRPDSLHVFSAAGSLRARTEGQRAYIEAMLKHDLVISVGPAGTGKTYLAVAVAVHLLKRGDVRRICLARPAVEAGE